MTASTMTADSPSIFVTVLADYNAGRHHGFKWSPSRGAWVHQITANAMYAARDLKRRLAALSAEVE